MKRTILITGATGYLGSALCVALSCNHRVIGLFRRPPSKTLRLAAPGVRWEKGDVADRDCLDCTLRQAAASNCPVDYIIHFAAYTDFGEKWQDEYNDTNVIGTSNIIESACDAGVKRILFAGSIAALKPAPEGRLLTEESSDYSTIAYSKSKALGEKLLIKNAGRIPVVILRLGGVFTDWCELPPLFSVMKMWRRPFVGNLVPGRGWSGFPYIHRKDVVRIVKKIIQYDHRLDTREILFASQDGCTRHLDLFPIIRSACSKKYSLDPIPVPHVVSKAVLHAKFLLNTFIKKNTYERAWMVKYADRPLAVDTARTCKKLQWQTRPELHILNRLPKLVHRMQQDYPQWLEKNIKRNEQKYEYRPD